MDDDLGRILLEGGGGGQMTESYELAMYFMARHTAIDCYEKRGRRGYLFIIGDELAYPRVKPRRGRDADRRRRSARTSPLPAMVAEVTRACRHLLHPARRAPATPANAKVLGFWRDLLGQNVIELDDLDAVCETIALTVGLGEDAIDLDEGLTTWTRSARRRGRTVSKALAALGRRPRRAALGRTDRPGGARR